MIENTFNKIDAKTYKKRMKKNPGYALSCMTPSWSMWYYDMSKNAKNPYANVKKLKNKAITILWPCQQKGKPCSGKGSALAVIGGRIAEGLNTSFVDNYKLDDTATAALVMAAAKGKANSGGKKKKGKKGGKKGGKR